MQCDGWHKISYDDRCVVAEGMVTFAIICFALYLFGFTLILSQLSWSRPRAARWRDVQLCNCRGHAVVTAMKRHLRMWVKSFAWAGRRLELQDVRSFGGMTVVEFTTKHHLKSWGMRGFPVLFEGTCNQQLDGSDKRYRARVLNPSELELLDEDGQHLVDGNLNTSQGTMHTQLWRAVFHTGWPVSLAVQAPVILAAATWLRPKPLGLWVVSLAIAISLIISAYWANARPASRLQELINFYVAKHRELGTETSKDPGPERAIRAGTLVEFHDFFETYIRDRNMYYVVANIVKPLTKDKRVSFAELVGATPVEWFVSHYWGNSFRDFCASISKHAASAHPQTSSWGNVGYWICSFSNNQYRIEEEVGKAPDCSDSSFYKALMHSTCQGTCMVVDRCASPLKRSWCLFELLRTIKRTEQVNGSRFQGLFFCTSSGVINQGHASIETSLAMGRSLGALDLQHAEASDTADKDKIDNLVLREMGSFQTINLKLKEIVAETLHEAKRSAVAEFDRLDAELVGMDRKVHPCISRQPSISRQISL